MPAGERGGPQANERAVFPLGDEEPADREDEKVRERDRIRRHEHLIPHRAAFQAEGSVVRAFVDAAVFVTRWRRFALGQCRPGFRRELIAAEKGADSLLYAVAEFLFREARNRVGERKPGNVLLHPVHELVGADQFEGIADHPRNDDAEQRDLHDLFDDGRGDGLRRVAEDCDAEFPRPHAVLVERIDRLFRERLADERAAVNPIAEFGFEDDDGGTIAAFDEPFGLGPRSDEFHIDVRGVGQVRQHDIGPFGRLLRVRQRRFLFRQALVENDDGNANAVVGLHAERIAERQAEHEDQNDGHEQKDDGRARIAGQQAEVFRGERENGAHVNLAAPGPSGAKRLVRDSARRPIRPSALPDSSRSTSRPRQRRGRWAGPRIRSGSRVA